MSLPPIDWALPGLAPWRDVGRVVWERAQSLPVSAALNAHASAGCPRFVPQQALSRSGLPSEAYEAFIYRTGCVPTRENLHDFFNGLVWLRMTDSKRQLNRLHAGEIARHGIGPRRGALRDALTLLDENGALLQAPPALWQALLARDWGRLFITQRALWQQARLLIVGHALLEKLLAGHRSATAHVLLAHPAAGAHPSVANEDAALCAQLDAAHLSSKPFTPLPVFGIPGWHADNDDPVFYDDAAIFRRPERRSGGACTPAGRLSWSRSP